MDEPSTNLRSKFDLVKSKEAELSSLPSTTGEQYQQTLVAAINAYEACRSQVIQLALFSSNEDFDEVSTSDIQYLAIDFLLAELLLKSYQSDRAGTLRKAVALYEAFLERLDDYGLLQKEDKKFFERLQREQLRFSLVTSSDFGERRRVKVERYQEEKALKQKLEYLRQQEQQINVDDETIRQLRLAELQLQVKQTFSSLDMMSQEYDIVSRAPQPQRNGQSHSANDSRERERHGDVYSDRLDVNLRGGLGRGKNGAILTKEGKPIQPFTLTSRRQDLRNGVFRPSHNLPTMSIEEYLEEEKRRGGIIEGGGEKSMQQPEPDEDNVELADQETMKARAWDEYVETNPKGSGNTINRG
ncbi:putative tor signaling pathway regulator [Phaeomoniella chlamydospora]|uniref:Putative tor signaling pathway regulator n=1 Tax=Phaeomoniella chlamydospora TaxID=158046 RepID=A0A0G2E7T2_PHACM|nr:putative tor signaling pathway regulator [Phaeomoniella chlamydospora]